MSNCLIRLSTTFITVCSEKVVEFDSITIEYDFLVTSVKVIKTSTTLVNVLQTKVNQSQQISQQKYINLFHSL